MPFEKRSKLRVVADTNIFISALHFGGEAEAFLGMAASRLFHLFVSPYILWEIKIVLIKKFCWSEEMVAEAQKALYEIAGIVRPRRTVSIIRRDEADNRILECAEAAKAHVLVTNDRKHLLPLGSFQGIAIVSLSDFLTQFRPK